MNWTEEALVGGGEGHKKTESVSIFHFFSTILLLPLPFLIGGKRVSLSPQFLGISIILSSFLRSIRFESSLE